MNITLPFGFNDNYSAICSSPPVSLLLLIGLFLGVLSTEVAAQVPTDPCVGGRLYYIVFPDTLRNTQDARFPDRSPESIALMIYSPVTQEVKLESGTWEHSLQVEGGTTTEFEFLGFRENTPLISRRNQPTGPVFRAQADDPIVIYAVLSTQFGTAGFTPLPVEAWGTEYYAATWPGRIIRNIYPAGETNYDANERVAAPAQIMIVAAYDDTEVTIAPKGSLVDCRGCTQVRLNAGEAYLVASTVDTSEVVEDQPDLAGSLIESTKPVGVLSGNTRTTIVDFTFPMLGGNSPRDMTAEWLRPVELHGTRFVSTPMRRISTDGGEAHRIRLFPTALPETDFGARTGTGGFRGIGSMLEPTEFAEDGYQRGGGYEYGSNRPSQVFQTIASSADFNGTTGSGNFIGASYTAWGSAMVELIPQEYWVTAAPFMPPSVGDYGDYLTVITRRSGADDIYLKVGGKPPVKVAFDDSVADTEFVWTTIPVSGGLGHLVYSQNGTRFTGHVFGGRKGYEKYTPGGTREKGGQISSATHPSEYEEGIARTYAFPLASSLCARQRTPGNYLLDTLSISCNEVVLRLTTRDSSALGLKYFILSPNNSENVSMELIEPDDFLKIDTARELIVRITRIDPDRSGNATIFYRDKSQDGEVQGVAYSFGSGALFATDPLVVRFDDVDKPTEGSLLLSNQTDRTIALRTLSLTLQDRGFTILRTSPEIPWGDTATLSDFGPGDTLRVWIRFDPEGRSSSVDTLVVDLECGRMALPVFGTVAEPCLSIGDLDFGQLRLGESKTLSLEICNVGSGYLSFDSIPLTWDLQDFFSVDQADIETLRGISLGPGECHDLNVTFRSDEVEGVFRTVARLRANTRKCRDTSIWSATVITLSVSGEGKTEGNRLISLLPNPTDGKVHLSYETENSSLTRITLVDPEGREVKVLLSENQERGIHRHTFSLDNIPSGLYFLRIGSGEWERVEVVRIVR